MVRLTDPGHPETGIIVQDDEVLVMKDGVTVQSLLGGGSSTSTATTLSGFERLADHTTFVFPTTLGTTTTSFMTFNQRSIDGSFGSPAVPTDSITPNLAGWYKVTGKAPNAYCYGFGGFCHIGSRNYGSTNHHPVH